MKVEAPPGLKVKYRHTRVLRYGSVLSGPEDRASDVSPRGGKTEAFVYNEEKPDELLASGIAYCHHRDNYNKRIGRAIALGRALKSMR